MDILTVYTFHKEHQGEGIGSLIVTELEREIKTRYGVPVFTVFSSITAKPFFEKRGYVSLRRNICFSRRDRAYKFLYGKKSLIIGNPAIEHGEIFTDIIFVSAYIRKIKFYFLSELRGSDDTREYRLVVELFDLSKREHSFRF